MKLPAVYIMANKRNGTLYVGVTSNLPQRVFQHRTGMLKGFSKTNHCHLLVYFEVFEGILQAITREKQLKAGSRAKKIALIETKNHEWLDLYPTLF